MQSNVWLSVTLWHDRTLFAPCYWRSEGAALHEIVCASAMQHRSGHQVCIASGVFGCCNRRDQNDRCTQLWNAGPVLIMHWPELSLLYLGPVWVLSVWCRMTCAATRRLSASLLLIGLCSIQMCGSWMQKDGAQIAGAVAGGCQPLQTCSLMRASIVRGCVCASNCRMCLQPMFRGRGINKLWLIIIKTDNHQKNVCLNQINIINKLYVFEYHCARTGSCACSCTLPRVCMLSGTVTLLAPATLLSLLLSRSLLRAVLLVDFWWGASGVLGPFPFPSLTPPSTLTEGSNLPLRPRMD